MAAIADRIPPRVDPLPRPPGALRIGADADESGFVAAGRRACVRGARRSGAREVWLGSLRALSGLRAGLPAAARVELSPGIVRRELPAPEPGGGPIVETVLALRELEAAALQWAPAPGSGGEGESRPLGLSLTWRCHLPPGVETPEAGITDRPALVLGDGAGTPRLLFAVSARRVRWRTEGQARDGAVRIHLDAEGEDGAPITLLVGGAEGDGSGADFLAGRLRHLDAEVLRWSPDGKEDGAPSLTSPEEAVDRALAWARHRVGAWRCGPPAEDGERGPIVQGLVATGAFDDARDLLDRWRSDLLEEEGRPGRARAGEVAEHVERAGEYLLWSGDRAWLGRSRSGVRVLVAELATPPGGEAPSGATRALRTLADGVEIPGGDPWSGELRQRADALERAGAGAETERPAPLRDDPALRALDAWRLGDPEGGFEVWRERLLSGMRDRGGSWGSPASAGLLPAAFLSGMLGARADAPFGRLRLAPAAPRAWARFEGHGISVGDAAVRLGYRRSGARHTFVVEQTRGRVPLNLVFAPLMPVADPGRVRVDGRPAEVQRHREGRRTRLRLQMPLDSTREVSVDGGAPEKL